LLKFIKTHNVKLVVFDNFEGENTFYDKNILKEFLNFCASMNAKSLGCIVWYNLQYFSLVGDEMIFNAIIEKDKHGYFARVPELEGCVSQGDTYEEVLENIKEALELYLESLSKEEKEELLKKQIVSVTPLEIEVA